jgi:hypothetical protein
MSFHRELHANPDAINLGNAHACEARAGDTQARLCLPGRKSTIGCSDPSNPCRKLRWPFVVLGPPFVEESTANQRPSVKARAWIRCKQLRISSESNERAPARGNRSSRQSGTMPAPNRRSSRRTFKSGRTCWRVSTN